MADPIEIKFTVPGEPVGKARPRARIVKTKAGGEFVSMYTPKKTQSEEGAIRHFANLAMAGKPPMAGPLELHVCAYVPVSASWPKKRQADSLAGRAFPVSKPDADNYGKLVMDAMNSIVYVDDAQVVSATFHKRFSDRPRIVVVVKPKIPNA